MQIEGRETLALLDMVEQEVVHFGIGGVSVHTSEGVGQEVALGTGDAVRQEQREVACGTKSLEGPDEAGVVEEHTALIAEAEEGVDDKVANLGVRGEVVGEEIG